MKNAQKANVDRSKDLSKQKGSPMLNVEKTKHLAKAKGIKIGFLCTELGFSRTYLNDVAQGKAKTISDDVIFKIARILSTTYEYLTDLTDDPDPNYAAKQAESPAEKLIHRFIERAMQFSPEQMAVFDKILNSDDQEFNRILSVVQAMTQN